ncbi:MAG: hypothetical protein Q7R98_01870 [Candidatus Jorgensenbacteria bacterium]|nr:hypothetical protein [Candidatus Jorgensenbacteria bacterium]
MSNEFAIAEVETGKLNALVKNAMRQTGVNDPNEAVRLINSGERIITRRWCEYGGIIYFRVASNGMSGPQWIKYFSEKGFRFGNYTESVLNSDDFKLTNGVVYEIAILKGGLFKNRDRTTWNIYAKADGYGYSKPKAEVACLIRKEFTDKEIREMGLTWILTMHEPIGDSSGDQGFLNVDSGDDGNKLSMCYGTEKSRWWDQGFGFAVVVSSK